MRIILATACFILFAINSPQSIAAEDSSDVTLSELSWIDKKYFDRQRQQIDDLGRENFGTRLRQDKTDIQLIQRILDNQLITIFEPETHKAIGIALGDVYVNEKGWHWKEYKDKQGRSHGVCLPKTEQCVFPISMFTRRLRVTTKLDIERIYQRGLDLMADVTPTLPYSAPKNPKETPKNLDNKRSIVVPYL